MIASGKTEQILTVMYDPINPVMQLPAEVTTSSSQSVLISFVQFALNTFYEVGLT